MPDSLKDAQQRCTKLDKAHKRMADSKSKYVSTSDRDSHLMKTGNGLKIAYNV
jgi:hypothetical protein